MPGWNSKRMAAYALICGLTVVNAGSQLACHHRLAGPLNYTQPPVLSYQTPTILASAGQPFASVAPDVSAYVMVNNVGMLTTSGFTFSVSPALPAGLKLDTATGVISTISGTPTVITTAAEYTLVAANTGGNSNGFQILLGVQDASASPVTLSYAGVDGSTSYTNVDAVSTAVGTAMTLAPPTANLALTSTDGHGFGVSPALPAGLVLSPDTGTVSGTPTAAVAGTTYTLTLTTATGCANATFTLLVAASAPAAPLDLGYAGSPLTGTVNTPFSASPTLGAGTSLAFNVAPPLPAGLSLDPLTGIIAGTPTAATAAADYTITASNASGNSQVTVNLTVN